MDLFGRTNGAAARLAGLHIPAHLPIEPSRLAAARPARPQGHARQNSAVAAPHPGAGGRRGRGQFTESSETQVGGEGPVPFIRRPGFLLRRDRDGRCYPVVWSSSVATMPFRNLTPPPNAAAAATAAAPAFPGGRDQDRRPPAAMPPRKLNVAATDL